MHEALCKAYERHEDRPYEFNMGGTRRFCPNNKNYGLPERLKQRNKALKQKLYAYDGDAQMDFDSPLSGQNRRTQAFVLHKSLVERHQFKIACLRECCQVRIGPNVCRECAKLSKDFQRSLYVIRFVRESSSLIVKKIFVELP